MRRLVAVLLLVWEPLALAVAATSAIDWLMDRGPVTIAFLILRLAITGVGIAAGARLWQDRAGGVVLARWSYASQLVATAVAHSTRLWPTTLPPGLAGPAFALGVAWYAVWLAWSLLTTDTDRT